MKSRLGSVDFVTGDRERMVAGAPCRAIGALAA
jgi:hypothetical protein